ncbi:MAG: UDP-N-acetylglucosamine 2-epimerase (non-hydrolyzing) [Candidatus Margulisiibacteriota bacterium]|nr:UDP-N-acetylglucosamine 2-epimerase (non-hydrolyzing) [Candidatus Margulisiibacteriota bacterium]
MQRKRIMTVFGTRPEVIKMGPVVAEIEKYPDILQSIIVSTGQHRQMLDQVLKIFNLRPHYDLDIMRSSQSLAQIVNRSLHGLETVIAREKPDLLLVQGDTSTVFAAALAAFYARVPVGHVEAGLRTGDRTRPFPEEINRRLAGVLADLHFAPTLRSVQNLMAEGYSRHNIFLTGNTVIDSLIEVTKREFDLADAGINLVPGKKTILVTVHRRESLGEPMRNICQAIKAVALKYSDSVQVVLPVHKNPAVRQVVREVLAGTGNISLIEPLDYEPFIHLMKASYLILTDSGGVQEEAPSLGKPVLVLREKTERPEAVEAGAVKLVGVSEYAIFQQTSDLLDNKDNYRAMIKPINPYGDGLASQRIVKVILRHFGFIDKKPEEFAVK